MNIRQTAVSLPESEWFIGDAKLTTCNLVSPYGLSSTSLLSDTFQTTSSAILKHL